MLASDEEVFAFLAFCAVFAFVVMLVRHGYRERMQRLQMLDRALRDPNIDQGTRLELVRSLERRSGLVGSWGTWLRENLVPRRVFMGAAWLTVLIGALLGLFGNRYDRIPGVVTMAIGLGVLALPIVIRELEAQPRRR
jgi:hypothetical protein